MKRVVARPFPYPHVVGLATVGDAIRAARTQAGLRLLDAALMLGLAVQTLADIESGKPSVGAGNLLLAAQGLGVDLFVLPRTRRDAAEACLAELVC